MNAIEMALLKKATKPSVRKDVPGELELHYGMFRMMPEGAKPHMATIEQAACMLPGVTAAEMNTSTGVFTVRYDPAQVDSARVKDWISRMTTEGVAYIAGMPKGADTSVENVREALLPRLRKLL